MTKPQGDPELPNLKLLDLGILPSGVTMGIRALRKRARDLGQCYVVSRRIYVTPEQLAAILESYRVAPRPKLDVPFHIDLRTRHQKALDKAESERARKRLTSNFRRSSE
ncbi:MAG: hypothetical protein F9K29_03625 [Hyphomicrobiaceae bacterium]|nr:MAG: hypothetical protein F9K29_03625 [Hyphomicrobiaceae bacterium]